ncbi:MAG: hypothetical protein WHT06_16865 [Desulfobacterales bacterium]
MAGGRHAGGLTRRFRLLALLILLTLGASCGGGPEPPPPAAAVEGEGISFFGIGRDSRYSEATRRELARVLGREAIERRSLLDLEIHFRGFLRDHLPEIDRLHRRLNDPPGERVDHEVTRLTYRYARQAGAPFDLVDLIFDGPSGKPLLFRMRFRRDEAGTVAALRERYGAPEVLPWKGEPGESWLWRRGEDLLVLSFVPDQFGQPAHRIDIYFVTNLEETAARREQARRGGRAPSPPSPF